MTDRMTPDSERSPAVAAATEPAVRDAGSLEPALTFPPDAASRVRRLVAGMFDFVVALIVAAWAGAIASNLVELGTSTSASLVIVAAWLGMIAYLASPWSLARRAFGMRIEGASTMRGATVIRGLVRVILLPVNVVMVLAVNRHVGDIATSTRVVRRPASTLCIVLLPIVIVVGYVGSTRVFLRAATRSEAWTKAQQVAATKPELQYFTFGDRTAVFESSWGRQELVRVAGTWYLISAQQRSDSSISIALGVTLNVGSLSIAGSRVSRVDTIDVHEVRTEVITKLAQQAEAAGMALRDVQCDDITGPINECRAQLAKPGGETASVRIEVRLDGKAGMTGKIQRSE
jgi:hypothetical protein